MPGRKVGVGAWLWIRVTGYCMRFGPTGVLQRQRSVSSRLQPRSTRVRHQGNSEAQPERPATERTEAPIPWWLVGRPSCQGLAVRQLKGAL